MATSTGKSVTNGQRADEDVFNGAFMSRKVDTETIGVVCLNEPSSGGTVTNAQQQINDNKTLSESNETRLDTLQVADLTDIDFTGLSDDFVIARSGGGWIVKDPVASLSIDDLTDVDTTTTPPIDGDVLTWVNANSAWEPLAPPSGGIDSIRTENAAYTAVTSDNTILADASGGAFAVTLYTAVGNAGRKLTIKKIDSSASVVTVDGDGVELIDENADFKLIRHNDFVEVQSDGTQWHVINYRSSVYVTGINTSGQSIPSAATTVVTNWTENFDSHTAFNPTTGVFVAPHSGYYDISFSAYFAATMNGRTSISIQHFQSDGTTLIRSYTVWDGDDDTLNESGGSASFDIYIAKDEQIKFALRHDEGANRSLGTDGVLNNITIKSE